MYTRLIRWAFTRFYREFAWTYDTVAALVSGGQWHTWALAALPFLQGRVLELGCGTGNLQVALAERPEHAAVGLDLSAQMLAISHGKLVQRGRGVRLVRASAGAIPFPPHSFDTLVATFPSEYIVAPETLAEIRRVVRPGGQVVILLAAHFHGATLYRRLIDLLYRITLQQRVLAPVQPQAPESIVGERLRAAGFSAREFWQRVGTSEVDLHVVVGERSRSD